MNVKKMTAWVFALLIALTPFFAYAQDLYQDTWDGILNFAANGNTAQQWLDETISPAAGSTMDYYVLLLNRYGSELDFSSYVDAAVPLLAQGEISNPVTRQKCALAVISCGALQAVPDALADETIGKLGVMSYVYGLHLLNNGAASTQWTIATVLDKLMDLQKEDGGWAVMGQFGDVDVTAMCLQALACNRGNNPQIAESIARGITFLSEKQLESGGFIGSGKENAESSAQVIVALTSLGIDVHTDTRFIKNGITVPQALMRYHMPDGGFAHLPDDLHSNETATPQAMQALSALLHPDDLFFDFSGVNQRVYDIQNDLGWKLYAWIIIAVLGLGGMIFALTRKRGRIKQLVFVLLLAGIASLAVQMLNIESAAGYYGAALPTGSEVAGHVTLSIRCDTLANIDDKNIPEDGVILEKTVIPFREGNSVFDVLASAARTFRIQMEHSGGEKGMAYVTGIQYLYEYAHGDLSGWVYSVNGETHSIGCGSYIVSDGDEILWQYTTQLGEDLKK